MLRVLTLVAVSVMVSLASTSQAQPRVAFFRELPDLNADLTPTAVATADFNNDGKIDIAVANSDSNDVSILLGNGDGTFLDSGASLEVGVSPVAIAVGDFNHDGKPDIITANENGDPPDHPNGSVAVLLNQGGGAFAAAVFTATGASPEAVVVGDFDGDPYPDVATADSLDDTVTVLKGVGDGTFTLAQSYMVGTAPMGLASGFLDADANVDLVVANSTGGNDTSGTLTVLKGMGGDAFAPQPEIPLNCDVPAGNACTPYAVAVAKFDGDSNMDLAVVNNEGDNVSILLGNGDLTFRAGSNPQVGSFPAAVAVGDFNGDGKTDIATSNTFDDNVSVLIGRGDGTFMLAANFDVGTSPWGIAADTFISGSSKPDLVTANQDDGTVSVLANVTGCVGDCHLDGDVTVDDLLTLASIGLGTAPLAQCSVADINQDMTITVDEIVAAEASAIAGCTK